MFCEASKLGLLEEAPPATDREFFATVSGQICFCAYGDELKLGQNFPEGGQAEIFEVARDGDRATR